jgi:type IV pilus assembly protein PilE
MRLQSARIDRSSERPAIRRLLHRFKRRITVLLRPSFSERKGFMYVSNTPRASYRSAGGFTLVELMVTVAIVAILLSIAVPSYSLFMKQSRRGEAEGVLMDIAQREQAYLLDQRAYAPNLATLGNYALPADVNAYFTPTFCQAAPPAACTALPGTPLAFWVVLTPKAGTAQVGDYTLGIDNTGAKVAVDSSGHTASNIW